MLTQEMKSKILRAQKEEITEYAVYQSLAKTVKNRENAEILGQIAGEELGHYKFFKNMTQEDAQPDRFKVFYYTNVSRMFGLNFGLKLMEQAERQAGDVYASMKSFVPNIEDIIKDEEKHELALLDLVQEGRLQYVSSVILGLNDALIELTATVAGFTLALQNTRLIGTLGLITGIAAAMSMAASEYLATKHEAEGKDPIKACLYTGISYIGVVLVLVLPYFLFTNIFVSLILTVILAVLTICIFTFYVSVAQGHDFKSKFTEMAILSVTITAITFLIGMAARHVFGIDV